MTLDEVKYQVALGCRILAMTGLSAGIRSSMGHVSLRDPNDPARFVVKGRGYPIDVVNRMQPEDMVVCDLDGRLLDGPPGVVQCNEIMIHACVFKARPEVQSVVHVHPPFSVMLTVLGLSIVPVILEGVRVVRRPIPVHPRTALITSAEAGADMVRSLGNADVVHLLGHGVTTVGKSMEAAVMSAWQLETQAQMNYYAKAVAGPDHAQIPDELIEEFVQWKPLAEPHFQEAIARVGRVNTGGSMWSDLLDRAAMAMSDREGRA
jgi:ribulose-5-phosphate 4-epimerase/fuculose-1-phosphate aldolase